MAKFSDLRDIGEQLGRFASVREKAEQPMDRIVIQANGGVLKLIAGNFQSTIIATVGPTEQEGRAVVSSRLLLSTVKTLKAKGEADFIIRDGSAVIKTGFGSAIEMPGMEMTNFLRPSPEQWSPDRPTVSFGAGYLPAACKYLSACVGDFSPFNQVLLRASRFEARFEAYDNHMGTMVDGMKSNEALTTHFPAEAFSSLRGIEDAGHFWFPERVGLEAHRAQLVAGRYAVVMVLWPSYPDFPKVAGQDYTAKVTGNKKVLIETFKSLAGRHEYHRVTMEAVDGTFTVLSGDSGKAKIDVDVTGKAKLPVNASYMAKVLNTVDGTNVTIEYANSPSLVRIVGDKNLWPILIAPMK